MRMSASRTDSTVMSKIVFTIRTVTCHTGHFFIVRGSVLSAFRYVRSKMGHLIIGICYLYCVLTIASDIGDIGVEGVLARLNTRLARDDSRQTALIGIKHVLRSHINRLLLLLLITWIVEIMAEEYIIVIYRMV